MLVCEPGSVYLVNSRFPFKRLEPSYTACAGAPNPLLQPRDDQQPAQLFTRLKVALRAVFEWLIFIFTFLLGHQTGCGI
jgi:hypothetical protein